MNVLQVSELSEASKLLAESVESTVGKTYRSFESEDLNAKNLMSQVNSIRLRVSDYLCPSLVAYLDFKMFPVQAKEETVGFETTNLEGYLAHHRDMIVLTAIEESRKLADDYLEETRKRWDANEWESTKLSFMESLGHRAQSWGQLPATSLGTTMFTPLKVMASGAVISTLTAFPEAFAKHAEVVKIINLSIRSYGADRESHPLSASEGRLQPCKLLLKAAERLTTDDGAMILAQGDLAGYRSLLSLLRAMTLEGDEDITSGHYSSICFPSKVVDESKTQSLHASLTAAAKAYFEETVLAAWQQQVETAALDLGSSSSFTPRAPGRTKQARLMSFVAFQIRQGIIPSQCVTSSSSQGALGGSRMNMNTFASSSLGTGGSFSFASPRGSIGSGRGGSLSMDGERQGGFALWAFVYYCMRSGSVPLAIGELQEVIAATPTGVSVEVPQVVLALLLALQSTVSETAVLKPLARPTLIRQESSRLEGTQLKETLIKCRDLFAQRLTAHLESGGGSGDIFLIHVLNLIGLCQKNILISSPLPQFVLEDFLWSCCWFTEARANYESLLSPGALDSLDSASGSGSSMSIGMSLKQRLGLEATIARAPDMMDFILTTLGGSSFFEQNLTAMHGEVMVSDAYRYAMVLMVCNRFGDAIHHLYTTRQVFPAAHLGVVGLYYGLIMPHTPLLHNPSLPVVENYNAHGYQAAMRITPIVLLSNYIVHDAFKGQASIAIDYLISLDSNWQSKCSFADLGARDAAKLVCQERVSLAIEDYLMSLDMDTIVTLVGDEMFLGPKRLPNKQKGYLTQYMSDQAILLHVQRLARRCLQARDVRRAVDFFMLAGSVREVAQELCNMLAVHWAAADESYADMFNEGHGKRQYWRQAADTFLQRVQANHTTRAMEKDAEELVNYLRLLLTLFVVVDKLYVEGQPDEALRLLDSLGLPPIGDSTTAMNPFLQRVISDVVKVTAKSIHALHTQLRSSPLGLSNNLMDRNNRLKNLQDRWTALIAFVRNNRRFISNQEVEMEIGRMDATMVWRI